jgi:hypothetical protein
MRSGNLCFTIMDNAPTSIITHDDSTRAVFVFHNRDMPAPGRLNCVNYSSLSKLKLIYTNSAQLRVSNIFSILDYNRTSLITINTDELPNMETLVLEDNTIIENCAVCLLSLFDQTTSCKTCKNEFHIECADQWFRTKGDRSCPLCRCWFGE